jgi:hypothetical protein
MTQWQRGSLASRAGVCEKSSDNDYSLLAILVGKQYLFTKEPKL